MGLKKTVKLVGNVVFDDAEINTITPDTGTDLTINGVTGKDIKFVLTDASGARKLIVIDSGAAEVASIDSNGVVTAAGGVVGELTGSVIEPADATHDYAAGHVDWTLSASEKKASVLIVTNADSAANIIGPAENRTYILRNASGQAITLKKTAGTGVAVANGKTAVLKYSSSVGDYIRVTADATH